MLQLTIKEYLREAKMTQTALAEQMGISPSALSKKINSGDLSIIELGRISEILGVPHTALLRAENEVKGSITCPECGNVIRITL